jgi:hypothetical protein
MQMRRGYAPLAHAWLEQRTHNPLVRSSTLRGGTNSFKHMGQLVELAHVLSGSTPKNRAKQGVIELSQPLRILLAIAIGFGIYKIGQKGPSTPISGEARTVVPSTIAGLASTSEKQ